MKKEERTVSSYVERESGGRSKISLVSRVYKEAIDERMSKLKDEIRFLQKIPSEWRIHFPEIIFARISKDKVCYEMPNYALPTIRRLLFSGKFSHVDALNWIDKILKFSFEMYTRQTVPKSPQITGHYIKNMHYNRVRRRLVEVSRKSPLLKNIIKCEYIRINGENYKNAIPAILSMEREEIAKRVFPEFLSKWGHFDLHFSNVLIDIEGNNFILIDPRGYPYCDYYYDFGKLWHSVDGKYEFIAENRFVLNDTDFELERNKVYVECEKIKAGLLQIFKKYSTESADDILMKTEFNEAIHFVSLVPFILDFDGIDKRATVGYYTGVILLNRFMEKYG